MIEDLNILAVLKHVEYTGFTIHPYIFHKDDLPYVVPIERVTNLNVDTISGLPEVAVRLFTIAEEIEPHALIKRFTKKKLSLKDFFEKKKELIDEVVKPFIDNKLAQIIELLSHYSIPLYDASAMPNLYPIDQFIIENGRARTLLRFDRKEDGTIYTLEVFTGRNKINLQDNSNFLITNEPCLLVHDRKIVSFEKNITGKILTPFFSKENIVIPKRLENKYFSSFIRKLVNNSEIIANGFAIHDVKIEASAVLSLETDWQGTHCIILKFIYGDKTILPDNPQKHFTELKIDDEGFTFFKSVRNQIWENEKAGFLRDTGLLQYHNCFKISESNDDSNLYNLIGWLINNKEKLEEKGFLIDNETKSKYVLVEAQLSQSVTTENDWFDLKIILDIGYLQVPFIQLRHNILNLKREFTLPDGKIFLIPTPWFERYRDLMIHSETSGGSMKLRKHHYQILDEFNIREIDEIREKSSSLPVALPALNDVKLRPYQETGFYWMVHLSEMGFGGILADDMGLGKTLQTITLLTHHYIRKQEKPALSKDNIQVSGESTGAKPIRKSEFPLKDTSGNQSFSLQLDLFDAPIQSLTVKPVKKEHISTGSAPESAAAESQNLSDSKAASLIVMPASLIHNWENELERFSPLIKKLVFTGTGRKKSLSYFKNYHVVLTTYGTLRNDIEFLKAYNFAYVILDEGQQIKNPSSQTAQSVFSINARHKFILTGTPVENSLSDLWSQFNFTNPGLLGDLSTFNTYYATPLAKDPESRQAASLLSIINPFILRRTKESVAPELPELTETINYCGMTEAQYTLYESEKSKIRNQVFEQIEKGRVSETPIMVLRALMKLRQIANHPRMIDQGSEAGSGKFEEITDKLETLIAENHRVLIFSSFVKHLNLIEEYCIQREFLYARLTGSTINRGQVVSQFKENEKAGIFLISLKAGGTGLNLTEADYVFMLDPWWNPAAEMQAINRAHRIGQNKSVFVYRFITKDSIEEKIMKLQEKKKALADAFVKPQSAISGMSKEEILKLFE